MAYKLTYKADPNGVAVTVDPVAEIFVDDEPYNPDKPEPPGPGPGPEPPEPPEGELLFDSNDPDRWVYSPRALDGFPELVKYVDYEGDKCLRFTLIPEHPCTANSFRCEIAQRNPRIQPGEVAEVNGWIVVPAGHVWGTGGNNSALVTQCHAESKGGPPWSIVLEPNGVLQFQCRTEQPNGKVNFQRPQFPLAWFPGQRFDFKVQYQSDVSDGWLKFWLDGELMFTKENGFGFDNLNSHYQKLGFYNPSGSQSQLREFRNVCGEWVMYGRVTVHRIG